MSNKSALRAALTAFIKERAGNSGAIVCKVKTVDATAKTCFCVPLNGAAAIPNARLQAQDAKGFLIVPKASSMVVVEFLSDGSAYVGMFSEIDSIQLNGEKFFGIPKVTEVANKIAAVETQVNNILNILKGITVPPTGGLVFQPLFAALNIITPTTQKSHLENTKVTHGDGT